MTINDVQPDPVGILNKLLIKAFNSSSISYGDSEKTWKISRDFSDFDFTEAESIRLTFEREYASLISRIQAVWANPSFQGAYTHSDYPKWYWIQAFDFSYWVREEGIAYISFHREDRELPYMITLGAISEAAIEEISEMW